MNLDREEDFFIAKFRTNVFGLNRMVVCSILSFTSFKFINYVSSLQLEILKFSQFFNFYFWIMCSDINHFHFLQTKDINLCHEEFTTICAVSLRLHDTPKFHVSYLKINKPNSKMSFPHISLFLLML